MATILIGIVVVVPAFVPIFVAGICLGVQMVG